MRAPGIAVNRSALGHSARADRARSSHRGCCLHRRSARRWHAPCLCFRSPRRGCALVGHACGAHNLHQQRRWAGKATRNTAAPCRVRDAALQAGRARLHGLDASRTTNPAGRSATAKTTEQRELLGGKQAARVLAHADRSQCNASRVCGYAKTDAQRMSRPPPAPAARSTSPCPSVGGVPATPAELTKLTPKHGQRGDREWGVRERTGHPWWTRYSLSGGVLVCLSAPRHSSEACSSDARRCLSSGPMPVMPVRRGLLAC